MPCGSCTGHVLRCGSCEHRDKLSHPRDQRTRESRALRPVIHREHYWHPHFLRWYGQDQGLRVGEAQGPLATVDFWDQFRDCFVHPGRSKEPSQHAMVALADAKKQRFPSGYSKAHDKEKVKLNAQGAGDPEAPATSLQFQILSAKMGQIM